jgi:shikimate kinase
MNKIIYLNGFMASGKSTIGPILANTLGWEFCDLDKVIEEEVGKTIVQIFQDEGEKFFRDKETEVLKKVACKENVIISLGGGTSVYNNNLEIIKKTGKVIYLKTSTEALFNRLKFKKDRPLFNKDNIVDSKENLRLKIFQLLEQRTPFYEQADLIINTDDYPLGQTIDLIAKFIQKNIHEKN